MDGPLPKHFFRIRDNGALVFRVLNDTRTRRLDFEQIAVVNVKQGEIKPHGSAELTEDDLKAIERWLTNRQATLAQRAEEEIALCIEQINKAAHWAQSKASVDDLETVTDDLILAMHDLRSVLLRKKAERLSEPRPTPEPEA